MPTATDIPTATESPTPTDTDEPTATDIPTATDTDVPAATDTPTTPDADEPTATNTPTPADTDEPIDTSTPTGTDTDEATATVTAPATESQEPTATETPTATGSPELTATRAPITVAPIVTSAPTALPANTPTSTLTDTVPPTPTQPDTATSTSTPTAADAELQVLPGRAEVVLPTAPSQPTLIVTRLSLPTLTFLPTMSDDEVAQLLATLPPRPAQSAGGVEAPTLPVPAVTAIAPAPAVTAIAPVATPSPDTGFVFAPGPSDATSPAEVGLRAPLPTPLQPTVAVQPELLPPTIAAISLATTFSSTGAPVYQYDVGVGEIFSFQNIQLFDGVRLFLPNPVDPENSWIRTDHYGMLRYKPIGAPQEGVMTHSPYHDGFSVPSIEQNKNRIVELDWSADGQRISFRIDPPQGTDTSSAGVWFWQPRIETQNDPTYAIIRDCPDDGYGSCQRVQRQGPIWQWKTNGVYWRPIQGDNTILLRVELPQERRNALALVQAVRNPDYANNPPHFVRYDYGHWNPDGNGIVVSGRRPDGRIIIADVNNDLTGERLILDGSTLGLWLRDAVRRPNGQVVALGRPGLPGSGPVALYDSNGRQISEFVGDAAPEDIRWYPDRNLVVVSVRGRQYTVQVEGGHIIDSTDLTRSPQFSEGEFGSSTIPAGVRQGALFQPGEQLRVAISFLNIRQSPSVSAARVGQLGTGDYVAILAGPYENEGYPWWKVRTAALLEGWIAGVINGVPSIRSP